ncbi:acyltransferase family protein [[Pseudomonas] boreopolis]|uniref:acyltransferase family protein n=1 Tax=Xanthomonas boreopolis TaxID=86183 RepID=UPI003D9BF14A
MNPRQGNGYFAHIDGLRAIAVLAVVAYHLDARWLPGGFTGVDVFFVISGFVVSASVDRLPRLGGAAELLRFYARRLRRIAPALVACLLATSVASALFIPESWLSETSDKTGRMAFVGLSNWVLASTGNDYFSPRTEFNPYTHTWSLGVEEQFYLLFPWLFAAWTRGRGGRALSLALFALAGAGSLAYAWTRSRVPGHEIDSFYLTTTRFWQLGAGVLLYQVLAWRESRDDVRGSDAGVAMPAPVRWLLALASLAAVGYGLGWARPGHSPWPDGAWPVLGTLGLIACLHGHGHHGVGRWLSIPPLVAIGRMSYSLYLWHWPVLVVLRWTVGLDSLAVKAAALALTFALAAVSYRWVETPFRHGGVHRWRNGRLVLAGAAALVLAAGLQTLVVKSQPYTSLSTVSRHPLDWYAYARGLRKEYPHCRQASSTESANGVQVRVFGRGSCDLPVAIGRRLFVIGDSHALAYNEMLRRLALVDGVPVRLYGAGGCAIADMQAWQGPRPECAARLQAALDDVLARARPGDVLFLPGLRMPRLAEQDELFDLSSNLASMRDPAAVSGRAALAAATVAQLRPLDARGVHVVVEAPKPLLQAPPYRCSDGFNRGNPVCAKGIPIGRAAMEAYRAPALEALQEIVARLPNASLWDPFPLLCGPVQCTGEQDGRPLYFDADHLSGHGNRVLLPAFRAHLLRLPPGG